MKDENHCKDLGKVVKDARDERPKPKTPTQSQRQPKRETLKTKT